MRSAWPTGVTGPAPPWPYLALLSKRLRDHVLLGTAPLQLLPELLHFLLHVLDLLKEFQPKSASLMAAGPAFWVGRAESP